MSTTFWASLDGSAGATGVTIQYPTLLNGYVKRPAWRVAGVDYAVGNPSGQTFKDPTNQTLLDSTFGAGIATYSAVSPATVTFTGGSNLNINGWDFNAVNVYLGTNTGTTTIQNCKFEVTAASVPSAAVVNQQSGSPNLTFNNNVVDGGGGNGGSIQFFNISGGGNVTLHYNWIKNCTGIITMGANSALDYQFNMLENQGQHYPDHTNYLQWPINASTTCSAIVQFNTCRQQIVSPFAPGEIFQFYNDFTNQLTFSSVSCAYNTFVTQATNSVAAARQNGFSYVIGGTVTSATAPAGWFFFCTKAGTSAGSVPAGYASPVIGTKITDGTAEFFPDNQAISYVIHGSSGTVQNAILAGPCSIHDNYFDLTSASGAFYPGPPFDFTGWSISSNYDMTTGSTLSP